MPLTDRETYIRHLVSQAASLSTELDRLSRDISALLLLPSEPLPPFLADPPASSHSASEPSPLIIGARVIITSTHLLDHTGVISAVPSEFSVTLRLDSDCSISVTKPKISVRLFGSSHGL